MYGSAMETSPEKILLHNIPNYGTLFADMMTLKLETTINVVCHLYQNISCSVWKV